MGQQLVGVNGVESSVGSSIRNESLETLERLRPVYNLHIIIDHTMTNQEPVVLLPHR